MESRGVMWLSMAMLVGCARSASSSDAVSPEPFERRLAANLAWQPGDAPAVWIERMARIDPPAPEAAIQPMQFVTEIRNRCSVPAVLAIGSAEAAPNDGVAGVALAAGAAIQFWLSTDERLFVRVEGSGWRKLRGAGGDLVLSGGASCGEITDLRAASPGPLVEAR